MTIMGISCTGLYTFVYYHKGQNHSNGKTAE